MDRDARKRLGRECHRGVRIGAAIRGEPRRGPGAEPAEHRTPGRERSPIGDRRAPDHASHGAALPAAEPTPEDVPARFEPSSRATLTSEAPRPTRVPISSTPHPSLHGLENTLQVAPRRALRGERERAALRHRRARRARPPARTSAAPSRRSSFAPPAMPAVTRPGHRGHGRGPAAREVGGDQATRRLAPPPPPPSCAQARP